MRPWLAFAMWILLISTTAATTAAAAPVRYGAKSLGFVIRSGANDATVGDFNHDGHPDVVIARLGYGNDGIVLGNGDGTFQPLQVVDPSGYWYMVAAGDLNGDTHLDLVVDGVRVYLGNGDGTFDPPATYTAPIELGIQVIDVDGDGKVDVISGAAVLAGNGDGTLGAPFTLEALSASYLDARDLDGDQDVDIVGARWNSTSYAFELAIVYLNQGGWSFTIADSFPIRPLRSQPAGYLRVVDLDGDDIPDLLNDGQFFRGVGDGTFGPAVVFGPAGGNFARIADLDEDGVMDVIDMVPVGIGAQRAARVYRGLGGGAFAAPVLHGGQHQTTALVTADFDSDGHADLGLTDYLGPLQIMLGNGDGSFGGGFQDYPVAGTPLEVEIGNVVGTTAPDVLVASAGVSFLRILPGLGDGSLVAPVDLPTLGEVRAVAVADLDQDGDNDVITVCPLAVSVFLGLPGGALGPRADFPGPSATSIAVGDLNGDGRPDVVVCPALSTYLTQPNGSLGPRTDYGSDGRDVTIAEVTGDAYPDVVIEGGSGALHLEVRPGSAGGALGTAITTSFTSDDQGSPAAFALGNVMGSAALDAIHGDARNLKALPGNGNGTFGTAVSTTVNLYRDFRSLLVPGEFTGDAFNDLVSAHHRWSGFGLFAGSGNGSFELEAIYGTGGFTVDLARGDLDGDGRPEVVTAVTNPSPLVTVHRPLPLGPVGVPSPRGHESTLALSRAWPNPMRSVLYMAFSLATLEPASLELIDLLGRRVHRENVSAPAPGSRTVRLAPARSLAPGLYWLRLSQGSAQRSLKVIVVD